MIGAVLKGYCNGYFGKDYGDKRIEAIGADWIVARNENGNPRFAEFKSNQEMQLLIKKWLNE